MIRQGSELVRRLELCDRIDLRIGDMCDENGYDHVEPSVVSSMLALHHLPDRDALGRLAGALARLVARTRCAVLLFDLTRLRNPASYRDLLLNTPGFTGALLEDAVASEAAAWTLAELSDALASAGLALIARTTLPLALFQTHWRQGRARIDAGRQYWVQTTLAAAAEAEASSIDRQVGVTARDRATGVYSAAERQLKRRQ
jgi:hypothetical protein